MQVATTDAFRPQWRRWDGFCVERGAAFDTDSLASTRPIEFEVISPEDAEAMYDILTYEKGAAVVRMLEQFLGSAQFRSGVKHYLTSHSYANTTTTDLWDSLEHASGVPVRAAMDTWIFQGGHPVVAVEATSEGISLTIAVRLLECRSYVVAYPNHYSSSGGFRTGRETGSVGGQP